MREIILRTWIVIALALLLLIISFVYATESEQSMWFSRAGCATTILGLLLTMKHTILADSRDIHKIIMEKKHYAVLAPKPESDAYQEDIKLAKHILRDEYTGLTLTVIGTIVWGYGDLIHGWTMSLI